MVLELFSEVVRRSFDAASAISLVPAGKQDLGAGRKLYPRLDTVALGQIILIRPALPHSGRVDTIVELGAVLLADEVGQHLDDDVCLVTIVDHRQPALFLADTLPDLVRDFRHIDVLDTLTKKAVETINSQSSDKPFFLYFPLTAPHMPILPAPRFQNKSGLNPWGDFVMQVDWTVGQVINALEKQGVAENTLLIVTSDNGATLGADFATLAEKGHDPSYIYRGQKADIFEGGHRVAFVARWPAVISAGTTCDVPICHTDLLATVAEITRSDLPDDTAEDSVSLLPLMNRTANGTVREATVHHSVQGAFAIRQGKWKLLFCPGSGGWSEPTPRQAREANLPGVQLYDLDADPAETRNLYKAHPEVVQRLTALMKAYVTNGRSTPGPAQANDAIVRITKGA